MIGGIAIYEWYDSYNNAKDVYDSAKNISERMDKANQNVPPPGKSGTDINPATGNPYAVDEAARSRKDFKDISKDIMDIGRTVTDELTPGKEDFLKDIFKKSKSFCP